MPPSARAARSLGSIALLAAIGAALASAPGCASTSSSSPSPEAAAPPLVTAMAVPPPPLVWRTTAPSWVPAEANTPLCPIDEAELADFDAVDPTCATPPSRRPGARADLELCDPQTVASLSCAGLGYLDGALTCSRYCTFDTRGCRACVPSARVPGCARADVVTAGPLGGFALATSASEIALAWVAGVAKPAASRRVNLVHFARFRPDLTKIMESDCHAETAIGGVASAADLRLVARPGGWLLAIQTSEGIALQPLDATGTPRTRFSGVVPGTLVDLIARPGGEPLLVYQPEPPYQGLVGVIVSKTGSAERGPVWVDEGAAASGVSAGEGFVLVTAMNNAWTRETGVRVTWLDANLELVERRIVDRGPVWGPAIAWTGDEAIATYVTSAGAHKALLVGRTPRVPTLEPTVLDEASASGHAGRAALPPNRSLMLTSVDGGRAIAVYATDARPGAAPRLEALAIDRLGRVHAPPSSFGVIPGASHTGYRVARLGGEVIVAWTTGLLPARIDLARVIP